MAKSVSKKRKVIVDSFGEVAHQCFVQQHYYIINKQKRRSYLMVLCRQNGLSRGSKKNTLLTQLNLAAEEAVKVAQREAGMRKAKGLCKGSRRIRKRIRNQDYP